MKARLGALGLLLGAVGGCYPEPAALLKAPPAMAGLPVAVVDDLKLAPIYEGEATAEKCAGLIAARNHKVVERIRSKLLEAGYRVVTQPASKDALVLEVSGTALCRPVGSMMLRVELTLALKADGRLLAQSSGEAEDDFAIQNRYYEDYGRLLNSVTTSLGLAEYAAAKASDAGGAKPDGAQGLAAMPAAAPPVAAPPGAAVAPTAFAPRSGATQPAAFALVIGIEKYRDAAPATGARADAERFAEIARKTLGIPEDNLRSALEERATKGDIEKQLAWLKLNVPAGGRVYLFFSGHGAPNPSAGTPFLFPYDGDPKYVDSTALPLDGVLKALEATKAREAIAFVDSCFSGAGGRSVLPKGTRPLVKVKDAAPGARVALFSAASGSEISGPTRDGDRGLFSKLVADGLGSGQADANADGKVTLQELVDWVKPRVASEARRDGREQTPSLAAGSGASAGLVVASGLGGK